MKKEATLILLFGATLCICCDGRNGYVISGKLSGFPDSTVWYLQNINTQEIIDSTYLIDGKFVFRGHLENVPEQIWLNTTVDNNFIYTNLLIGNDKIVIEGDIQDFPWNVRVSGSGIHDDFDCLQKLTSPYDMERDALVRRYFELPEALQQEKGKAIWDSIGFIDKTADSIRIGYMKSHINTYSGLIQLGYLKKTLPKDTVEALYHTLSPELKDTKYAKAIETYLSGKIPEVGDTYLDFEAYNKDGDNVKLSQFLGKYVLLDFTASYCAPCIQAAEELREIDEKYLDSLSVISFSADANKDVWLKSLERDQVTWLSVWDGKGTFSDTYIKYGISGFPTFLLINPEGSIIAKWSGYGKGSILDKVKKEIMI